MNTLFRPVAGRLLERTSAVQRTAQRKVSRRASAVSGWNGRPSTKMANTNWISQHGRPYSTAPAQDVDARFKAVEPDYTNMQRRMSALKLREVQVAKDGNCLFRSISAALNSGSEGKHPEVRYAIANWLQANENLVLQNGAKVSDFLDVSLHPDWKSYIHHIKSPNAWGDHLCLFAAANVFGVQIKVVSSVKAKEDSQALSTIDPISADATKTIYLSNWHESHFNYCVQQS
eukprot:TRINITY_DN10014_c0_g1_i1.p1 TRINITY_DN10014_c0_g1~~TRINITY_DN10014_c0_g1_i1.p1  ORF type:complete len:231 (-),score=21.04 TRINITY_DN10014_c0_g1_i1:60-752(-)